MIEDAPSELIPALARLRRALDDAGPNPEHHLETELRHRREWPALWDALDQVHRIIESIGESEQQ